MLCEVVCVCVHANEEQEQQVVFAGIYVCGGYKWINVKCMGGVGVLTSFCLLTCSLFVSNRMGVSI